VNRACRRWCLADGGDRFTNEFGDRIHSPTATRRGAITTLYLQARRGGISIRRADSKTNGSPVNFGHVAGHRCLFPVSSAAAFPMGRADPRSGDAFPPRTSFTAGHFVIKQRGLREPLPRNRGLELPGERGIQFHKVRHTLGIRQPPTLHYDHDPNRKTITSTTGAHIATSHET